MEGSMGFMTENKRFTMCHEQNDIIGWTMSIVDWQTKQPFDYTTYEVHSSSITDTKDEMEDLCLLLNELNDENKELKARVKSLRNDLIDYSALVKMLEDAKALEIEDMIWNTMGYKTQTEFDDDFADYREKAKKRWRE